METPTTDSPTFSKGNTSAEDSAEVKQSASELVAKHRKQRADKGKPRGPRSGKDEVASSANPPVNDAVFQLNVELVKKSVTALVHTADAIVCRRIYNKSTALGCDENLAKEYTYAAGLTKDESVIIADCTASIMARSDFLIRHAPEVMLGCVLISYSVRVVGTLKRLDELEAKLEKKKKGQNSTPLPIESSAQ